MTSSRITLFFTVLIIGLVMFVQSCKEDPISLRYSNCDKDCSPCMYKDTLSWSGPGTEYCICQQDTVNFNYHCPPNLVHAYFDYYDSCKCVCECGWTGTLCDQRDTTYYARFRFGDDTTTFNGYIGTNSYTQAIDTWKFFDFDGTFPTGSGIDTLIFSGLPAFPFQDDTSHALCATGCIRIDIILANGSVATASSGTFTATIDSLNKAACVVFGDIKGIFRADLATSSGTQYYIREGNYSLPY